MSLARRARSGFTAVELMVAITAALVVSAGAYTLARSSLEVFQQEARMNAAQYSNTMGVNRLVTDIQRSGFMTSPDASSDLQVCVQPAATSTLGKLLRAVNVEEGADAGTYGASSGFGSLPDYPAMPGEVTDAATNARAPDRLRLAGNFTTTDKFKLGAVDLSSGKIAVEVDQLSVQRIFRDQNDPNVVGPGFCELFPIGSVVRLVDATHRSRFAEISDCASPDNTESPPTNYASITLETTGIATGPGCGELTGGYLNPVNIIDYAPIHLTAANAPTHGLGTSLATLMDQDATMAGIVGDGSRLALVRRELLASGAIRANSATIVADYLADLNFSARVANAPLTPNVLTDVPFGAVGAVNKNRIRSLGVRLSTRARNPDRATAPPVPDENDALQRFAVFPALATNRMRFARVRTTMVEVHIPNLQGVAPW